MRMEREEDPALRLRGPAVHLGLAGLAMMPVALLGGWAIAPAGVFLTLAILLGGVLLAARGMAWQYPHDRVGACNLVTLARLAATAVLGATLAGTGQADWAVFALAVGILSLDGVDGWLARRQGVASEFGARFDMEVDAAMAAILALSLHAAGRAGPELWVLGGARYAFVVATALLPWLAAPLPASLRRKAVCVVQIGTLAALSAPPLPEMAARPLALGAATLVLWSFGRDIRRLAGRR